MKRHIYQIHENKHHNDKEVLEDADTVNAICDLYDRGITTKMIKKVFKDIEVERKNDEISDFEVYRL